MSTTAADALAFSDAKGEGGARKRRFLPDPGYLWLIFRRRLPIFVLLVLATAGLIAAYTMTRPRLYTATATVVVEPRRPEVIEKVEPVSAVLDRDSSAIDTEVQILSSRRLASRVARKMDAAAPPGYAPARQVSEEMVAAGMHPNAAGLLASVDVQRVGLTYLIEIESTADDPELAALIANAFAREYLLQQQEAKSSTAGEGRAYIQSQMVDLRNQAAAADAALQRYKIEQGLMSAEGATMAEQEVSTLNQQIATARAQLAEKEGQLAAARTSTSRGGTGADLPAALQSGTVAELRRREAELSGRLADLNERYGDLHPDVIRLRSELADTREQLQRQIDRVVASLQAEVQAARSRLASLLGSQSQARGSLASNSSAQVGLAELERNSEAATKIYEAFLNRSREMLSQEGLVRPDARIEALARVPAKPSSPNIPLALAAALVGAPIVGFGGIALAEYLDARLRTRADVEEQLQLPYLGAVPDLHTLPAKVRPGEKPFDYLVDHPHSSFAESIRSLKTSLLLGGGQMPCVIAITSALPRESKSTTAICLARTIALAGLKCVLVDCDVRRRAASEQLLEEGDDGLLRALSGEPHLSELFSPDPLTPLQILGLAEPPEQDTALFTETRIKMLMMELRSRFDVIILDTAPVLGIAETRAIAAAADKVLLVGRWRRTSIKAANTAVDLLLAAGVRLEGMALTMVDVRQYASTGQEDVYNYHRQFKGYYTD